MTIVCRKSCIFKTILAKTQLIPKGMRGKKDLEITEKIDPFVECPWMTPSKQEMPKDVYRSIRDKVPTQVKDPKIS